MIQACKEAGGALQAGSEPLGHRREEQSVHAGAKSAD